MSIWKVPRVTTAQRLTLVPDASEILFDTNSNSYWGGDGTTTGGISLGAGGDVESPTIAFNDLSPIALTTLQAGDRIVKATVVVSQAFDGTGASVTVGTDLDNDVVVSDNDIDVSVAGTYEVFPLYKATGATNIKIFVTPGTLATSGEVFITLITGG